MYSKASRMALGPIHLPAQGTQDLLSPGEKWWWRQYEHSPPPSVDIEKNISPSPYAFLAFTGTISPAVSPTYLLL